MTDLDRRAVAALAADMHRDVAIALDDLFAEAGLDRHRVNNLLGLDYVVARHDDATDTAVCGLMRKVEDGTLLGQGGPFWDDNDLTATEFTALTTAAPNAYLAAAASERLTWKD